MIHIHTKKGCTSCNIAKVAMQMADIEFEEKGLMGIDISGGLPIICNTKNGKVFNGWPGSINKLKEAMGL